MNYTTNYNLKLPEKSDLIDVADFNYNATAIDAKLKDLSDDTAALPTIQTAVADNSTAITNLQTRVGEAESDILANTTEINGVKTVNESQWSAINTNGSRIETANNKIAALEKLEGDIVRFNQGTWSLNPAITKKLTFIATGGSLDYSGKFVGVIPAEYLPANFSNFFVNASVCSASNNENIKTSLVFNRAYISNSGELLIEFTSIKSMIGIAGTQTDYDLNEPSVNNLTMLAEIIFI